MSEAFEKKKKKQGTQTKPKYSLEAQAIKTRGSALTHPKSQRGLCGQARVAGGIDASQRRGVLFFEEKRATEGNVLF